jgi:hypothetical protein
VGALSEHLGCPAVFVAMELQQGELQHTQSSKPSSP